MTGRWALALGIALAATSFCAGSARAETSIYVAKQPGLDLVLKADGEDVYATYLRATLICRGAGSHWEESNEATDWAFTKGPVELRRRGGGLSLIRLRNGPFDSSREVVRGRIQPDRIVGSFSFFASGEGIGGTCEADAPGFEPEFGEREPAVPFEAQRYVPLGTPLASAPDPAEEALYFTSSKLFEIYLGVEGGSLARVHGTAMLSCLTPMGKTPARRYSLGFDPPYPLDGQELSFDAQATFDYGFKARFAQLTGTVDEEAAAGRLRIFSSHRAGSHVTSRCRTGQIGGDGYLAFSAGRYLPVTASLSEGMG